MGVGCITCNQMTSTKSRSIFILYPLCILQINLKRRRTPVLLQTYLPSGLFVVVSWISFIVPPEIVPGKTLVIDIF